MADESKTGERLNLGGVIGFEGAVPNGFIAHPDGTHVVYPLGSTVVIKNTKTNTQAFLQGHTDKVSCVTLSNCGRYIASGQVTAMGFKATVIVWDAAAGIKNANTADSTGELLYRLDLHKVKIQDLSFSPNSQYLATLGGQDDNNLVIWDVETGKAICGSPAASHSAKTLTWFNHNNSKLVTGGEYNLRIWDFDSDKRKLKPTDAHLGQLKRVINTVFIEPSDTVAYCGTQTGDLLEVNINNGRFVRAGRERFSLGIQSLGYQEGRVNHVIVGAGDGTLAKIDCKRLSVRKAVQMMGSVTSISAHADGRTAVLGTDQGNTYRVKLDSLDADLLGTAHYRGINDICFPTGCSDIFVTCSTNDIRVWNAATRGELLRIQVPNLVCNCVAVLPSGKSIVSGWNDGKIRAFYPESGKMQYIITDAHSESVTAIACTHDNTRLVSGGKDGRVRVWDITGRTQTMQTSFKEHKAQVNKIVINSTDEEAVSASADGSCIVWNIKRGVRTNALFASTLFRSVVYHPDESQLLTCGSDRKLTYWDASDCNAIRILEGSTAEINALDIGEDGTLFVSGGNDKLVKVFHYDEGTTVATGAGHSGGISCITISPDQRRVVSVGAEGAIFVWDMPSSR